MQIIIVHKISKGCLPWDRVISLDLSSCPLHCDCRLAWLANTLKNIQHDAGFRIFCHIGFRNCYHCTSLHWYLWHDVCSTHKNGHFCQKCQSLRPKKWHFEWPNQNSKTTFIVQTFPKYGPYDFYLVNLSLLGAILAIFQFCGFSGLFWPFFPCK